MALEYGTVTRVALIHMRFGSGASWWTINSVLDGGPLRGRVAQILGFVSLCLITCHAVLVSVRLFQKRETRSDRYFSFRLHLSVLFSSDSQRPSLTQTARLEQWSSYAVKISWLLLALSEASQQRRSARLSCDCGSVVALMVLAAGP